MIDLECRGAFRGPSGLSDLFYRAYRAYELRVLRSRRRRSGGVGRAFGDGDVMAQDGRRYREWCIVDEAGW